MKVDLLNALYSKEEEEEDERERCLNLCFLRIRKQRMPLCSSEHSVEVNLALM